MPRRPAFHAFSAAVLAAFAGLAQAQSVEFRIIERQGQTVVPSNLGTMATTDAVLNYAVQARVVGGTAGEFLGNFSFDIVASGEADSYGTLAKLLISNADGTYTPNTAQVTNNAVGRGGLAAAYSYLAGISPNYNGLLNTSGGAFTNTPGSQEVGLVTGSPAGNSALLVLDPFGVWNPPIPFDPAITAEFLGAAGNFVDVYRFKYTVTTIPTSTYRAATFSLQNITAQVGTAFQLSNGLFSPVQSPASATATGSTVFIGTPPSPGVGASIGVVAMLTGIRRRRDH